MQELQIFKVRQNFIQLCICMIFLMSWNLIYNQSEIFYTIMNDVFARHENYGFLGSSDILTLVMI